MLLQGTRRENPRDSRQSTVSRGSFECVEAIVTVERKASLVQA